MIYGMNQYNQFPNSEHILVTSKALIFHDTQLTQQNLPFSLQCTLKLGFLEALNLTVPLSKALWGNFCLIIVFQAMNKIVWWMFMYICVFYFRKIISLTLHIELIEQKESIDPVTLALFQYQHWYQNSHPSAHFYHSVWLNTAAITHVRIHSDFSEASVCRDTVLNKLRLVSF